MAGNPDNLIPNSERTPEERRANAKKAGEASGKARKEKKLMSQIMAEFLDKDHEILSKDGLKEKISGSQLISRVMSKVLSRGDSASVQLIKAIHEATEGQKINFDVNSPISIIIEGVEPEPDSEQN